MRADTKLTAQQMLDYGFATQIVQPATALAIMPTTATTSADADQLPGWAQQFMSKLSLGLAAMTTALATLKTPTKAEAPVVAPVTALDVTTDSGVALTIATGDRDTYEVGDAVTDAEGNAPADASYVLTDGNTIAVAAGAITAITPADTTDTTASAADGEAMSQVVEAVTTLATTMNARFTALEKSVTATTALATRAAAGIGSKASPTRAAAANDEDKEAPIDPVKAAGDARKARRDARFNK
jgi:hypothetical protein